MLVLPQCIQAVWQANCTQRLPRFMPHPDANKGQEGY